MLNIEANYGKYYLYILIGLFIGFISLPQNVYILFYVVFITLLLFLIISFYKKSIVILYIILILIFLQDFIAVLFSTKINANTIYLFVLYKELLVYILLLSTFILIINNYSKISKLDFLIVVSMFITLFYFFLSPQLIQAKLLSARQFILPFILVLFGRYLFFQTNKVLKFIKFYIVLTVLFVLIGIFELLFLKDKFWLFLNIGNLYHIQGLDSYIDPVRGVTRNFWTWDFYGILGVPLRRMVSFFLDPILLGHNITFMLTITLYCTFNKTFIFNKYAMLFINIILFTGLILTLSKGAIMAFVITMLLYLKNRKTTKWLYYILLLSTILFVSMFIKYSLNNGLAGASHFNGLTANLTSIFTNPMGVGLGFAGNMARYGHNNHDDLIAGESYVGTVIGQMGLVGTIILILFIKYIVKYGKKNINNDLFNTINKAIVAVLIGNLISSSMSESVISLTGSGMLFILFGYFSNLMDKEKQFRKEKLF